MVKVYRLELQKMSGHPANVHFKMAESVLGSPGPQHITDTVMQLIESVRNMTYNIVSNKTLPMFVCGVVK